MHSVEAPARERTKRGPGRLHTNAEHVRWLETRTRLREPFTPESAVHAGIIGAGRRDVIRDTMNRVSGRTAIGGGPLYGDSMQYSERKFRDYINKT